MSAYPLENDVRLYMKEKVVCTPENKIRPYLAYFVSYYLLELDGMIVNLKEINAKVNACVYLGIRIEYLENSLGFPFIIVYMKWQ